jgi:D-tyrosyl-tRNA(Tyr) deacylase
MWLVDEPLLTLNYANEKFLSLWHTELSAGESHSNPQYLPNKISDIIFLSKHAAASGTLSLTVHPVGIPWVLPEDEENCKKSGGIPGKCSPPSIHIGSLYRAIIEETKSRGLDSMFQVTLEATHHGPYVPVPACFVEIGSTETEWINGEAGRNWSECLGDYFHLMRRNEHEILEDSFDINFDPIEEYDVVTTFMESTNMISFEDPEKGLVVITIGAGHYVPKMNDMVRSFPAFPVLSVDFLNGGSHCRLVMVKMYM